LSGTEIHTCHQLTPELAEDVADSSLVVLVDACDDGSPPGSVSATVILAGSGATSPRNGGDSHAFDPVALVTLAAELFDRVPPVVLVTVSVGDTDVGEQLSPAVALAVPVAVDAVVDIINRERSTNRRSRAPRR